MNLRCAYCNRMRTNNKPCPGCGRTEIVEEKVNKEKKYEFFYEGYFVKVLENLSSYNIEYFFFRGETLVDRLELNFRDYMLLKEARGIKDGEDGFYLIWEMFEESQKGNYGVVKTYENDPKHKRIEVMIVPWGTEYCQAVTRSGGQLCRIHGGHVNQMGPPVSVDGERINWSKAVSYG